MTRIRPILHALAAVAVAVSAVVLVWSAVATSSARVNATTEGTSFFSAGVVELARPDSVVELLFDADGLHPGMEVSGCVEIEYRGSIPASVRLHAARRGGTGLEDYIDLRMALLNSDTCAGPENGTHSGEDVFFEGRLASLWSDHPDFADAIVLEPSLAGGVSIAIEAVATVADDNRAQGLTTDFALTIEARP